MGKIIDKVRQREFDAMLYRRALEREAESSKWLQELREPSKTRIWRAMPWQTGSAHMPPLPKSSNSG